jgi:serine protease Do
VTTYRSSGSSDFHPRIELTLKSFGHRLIRVMVLLVAVTAIVALSALSSSYLVTKQLAKLLKPDAPTAGTSKSIEPETPVDIDFYESSGIKPEDLRKFLETAAARDHLKEYPAHLTFENDAGDCLIDHPVAIHWKSGQDRVMVGQSGVLRIMLRPDLLPGLKFRVPQGFRRMKQHTIPLGTAYEPYGPVDPAGLGRHVVNDYDTSIEIWRQLARQRAAGLGLTSAQWRDQMLRRHCDRMLPNPAVESDRSLTVAEINRKRRASVVVIGHLLADGQVVHAAGVVLDASGVIATAYHVVDKPTAAARCVQTADGKTYPIQEILAADRPNDIALLRVEANGLTAAPLSMGDDEGSPLTIIAHPASEFYSVTQGHLRRFQTSVVLGKQVVRMAVTADFTDGSSGGPVFNDRGEVAGIVSLQHPTAANQTARIAAPARAVRNLFRPSMP